ncbi:MAG: bifunctional nuclease family protein [Candidatus Gastranaerophilales bacterium]|nr:bifunctional nuclease family protein [Candidatus Gastranaerophilales bacterium]
MIEMKVMGIAIDTASGSPIIVLNDKDNRKALPIWIGSAEASAIIRKIENIKVIRPMTHDLLVDTIEKTGCTVDRVEINDVEKDTYFSTIYIINSNNEEIAVDARPSDAIAVAIRVDAPIFVSAKVLADGSVSCDAEKDEEESQEFRNFIQSIKPSDFEKLLKDDKHMDQ